MKTYATLLLIMVPVFSFNSFGQHSAPTPAAIENATLLLDGTPKDGLVIVGYYVEETVHMAFGKRITQYEVPKISMIDTYYLGPNNTRTVTPIYGKAKVKIAEENLQPKTVSKTVTNVINPVNVAVIAPTKPQKYINVDVVTTYEKVIDKGYKTPEMLAKVADRAYFEGDLVTAAKYYGQLIEMNADLEAMYYYRYAQSLKGTEQIEKANEIMKLFEIKNSASKVARK